MTALCPSDTLLLFFCTCTTVISFVHIFTACHIEIYFAAVTVLGVARFVTGLLYIFVTRHVILSSLCMYAATATLQSVVMLTLISRPSESKLACI